LFVLIRGDAYFLLPIGFPATLYHPLHHQVEPEDVKEEKNTEETS